MTHNEEPTRRCAACGDQVNGRAYKLQGSWYCGEHATWIGPQYRGGTAPDAGAHLVQPNVPHPMKTPPAPARPALYLVR